MIIIMTSPYLAQKFSPFRGKAAALSQQRGAVGSVHTLIKGLQKRQVYVVQICHVKSASTKVLMFVKNTILKMSPSCCTDAPARHKEKFFKKNSSHITNAGVKATARYFLPKVTLGSSSPLQTSCFVAGGYVWERSQLTSCRQALRSTLKVYVSTTTPMTTAEAERCFSTLKRVQSFLRSTLSPGGGWTRWPGPRKRDLIATDDRFQPERLNCCLEERRSILWIILQKHYI